LEAEKDIIVSIADDGGGTREIHDGIGIAGIRERLSLIDGRLEIRNNTYGFELIAMIPIHCEP